MRINCIAVDDEPLALEKIREYVSRIGYLNLLECFDNGADALVFLKEHHVDLIYLDIQMELLSGIELIESLLDKPKIILTTAYDKYAIKAFELDVVDYLLKPISFPRFLKAAEKAYESLSYKSGKQVGTAENPDKENTDYFFVKSGSSTIKIDFIEILYVEGMKDYLAIKTIKKQVLTLLSFNKLEQILPSQEFVRIHKSYLVALRHIEKIENNQVKIKDKLIPIGGNYKKLFLDIIEKRKLF